MLTVFGSINVDIGIRVQRFPRPGETLLGRDARISPGGKGANQSHAARLFGADVVMVGAVGHDDLATTALASMRSAGVDVDRVRALTGASTGIATIYVTADAENSIVVAPGANSRVQAAWVDDALLEASRGLMLQMEVPAIESMAVALRAKAIGCPVTLNLAPATSIEAVDFAAIDTLIVNESELGMAIIATGTGGADIAEQIARLSTRWHMDVLVTLGAAGAMYHGRDGVALQRTSFAANVVDTTGAGDTFTGVFGAARADGATPDASVALAIAAAGLACGRRGAQISQPSRQQIDQVLSQSGIDL